MTLSKWGYLFGRTLALGTLLGLILGIVLKIAIEDFVFEGVPVGPYEWIFIVLGASVVAVVSHAGLFAYLILRFMGMSLFRKRQLWDILQVAIMAITFFDLIYLRLPDEASGTDWVSHLGLPLILLAFSLLVAYRKVRETNRSAWIPTLFFMFVGTTLEAVPALRLDQPWFVFFTVTILAVCNAWQILMLHRLIDSAKG